MTKRTLWYAFLVLLCCGALVFVVNATGNQTPKVKQDASGVSAPAKTQPAYVDAKTPARVPAAAPETTESAAINKVETLPEETPTAVEREAAARLAEEQALEAAKLAAETAMGSTPVAVMKDDERASLAAVEAPVVEVEAAAPITVSEEDLRAEIARITAEIEAAKADGFEPSAASYYRLNDLENQLSGGRAPDHSSLDQGGEDCANAVAIDPGALPFCEIGTMGATNDCQLPAASPPYLDIFYSFQPSVSGIYRVGMVGTANSSTSSIDSYMRIWRGDCCVGTNYGYSDDDGGGLDPALDFQMSSDSVYYIEIGHYSSTAVLPQMYRFQLSGPADASVPANDLCANAIAITPGTYTGKTRGATDDLSLTSCGTTSAYNGVWYTVTGTGHNLTVSTNSLCTNGDTYVRVYSGTCGAFTCVGYNNDIFNSNSTSEYTWCADNGVTYYIVVSSNSSTTNRRQFEFTMTLTEGIICACDQMPYCGSPTETEPNNQCASFDVTTLACDETIYGLHCPEADSDWFKTTIPANTILTLSLFDGGNCDVTPPTLTRFSYRLDSCTATIKGPYTTPQSILNCTANPQDVYVMVYAGATAGRIPYKLTTACTTELYCGTPVETEPNNTCATFDAQVLNCANPVVYGLHCPASDSDFYQVYIPAGTYATIKAFDGPGCTTNLPTTIYTQLYTAGCVASGSASTANKIINRGCSTTDTTVYLLVKNYGTTTQYTSAYKIELSCSTLVHPDNDLCANAELMAIGSSTLGSTAGACYDAVPTCDGFSPSTTAYVIWYQFTGNGNLVEVGTCNPATTIDPRVLVYSGDCNTLVCETGDDDDCVTPSLGSLDTLCTQPGVTYYVCVYSYTAGEDNFQLDLVDLGVSCQIGRCCYGDFAAPSCTDTTQARCDELGGVWQFGINCTSNPCPATLLGEFCQYPIPITAFPYQDIDSTCLYANDYNDVTCMGTTYYDNGPDVLYSITVAQDTCITVTLTSTSNTGGTYPYGSVTLFDGCPTLNQCVATAYASTSPVTIVTAPLSAGVEYFLMVDNWPSPPCIYYTLDVNLIACPAPCPPVVCEGAAVEVEPNGGCKTTPYETWNAITCGGAVQGYVAYSASIRDYDGYEFVIGGTDRQVVTLTLDPEFNGILELRNYTGACPDGSSPSITVNNGVRCDQEILQAVLLPGTYHVYVYPVLEASVLDSEHYCMSMTCEPWVCPNDFTLTAPGMITGDLTGAGDDCDLRVGVDQITAVTIPYESDWLFSMCSLTGNFDSYMYISYTCCGAAFAYDDDGCASPNNGLLSAMDTCIHLMPGVVYVDIEPYSSTGTGGPYDLIVTDCVCPPVTCTSTVEEAEPNNGCNDSTFQAIVCGDIVHGTVTASTSTRDVDAYTLVLATPQAVTMVVQPEFDALLGIYRTDGVNTCPDIYVGGVDDGINCETETYVSPCLPAGEYHIYVSPTFTNIPNPADYCLTVTCEACVVPTGRCCYGADPFAPLCANNNLFECTDLGGEWTEGITCESEPCPLPPTCDVDAMVSQRPYLSTEGWSASTCEASLGYEVFDDFFSVDAPIGSITFWGLQGYFDGAAWVTCSEDPLPVDITFYGYGAEPGIEVCTYSLTLTGTQVTTGGEFNGIFDLWEYTAVLDPPCALNPGWVGIQTGGATDCYFLWMESPDGNGTGLQWDGTAYSVTGDFGLCLGAAPCDKVEDLTIYRVQGDPLHAWLHFTAPQAGDYNIYTTTVKNNDGEPDGGLDPNFGPAIAMVTAATNGEVVQWIDTSAYVPYRNYVVTHNCVVEEALGRCCYGDFMAPTCLPNQTMSQCDALNGTWTYGIDCTTPCPAGQYCEAGSGYTGCDEYISNVTVGTINNTTVCIGGTINYADYTTLSTTMTIGTGYAISVTNGNPYANDALGIWVDWNRDGDFDDANEAMAVTGSPGVGPYTATITPPAGSFIGNVRMRIRLTWNVTPVPCGVDSYGEVEDYTINVVAAP